MRPIKLTIQTKNWQFHIEVIFLNRKRQQRFRASSDDILLIRLEIFPNLRFNSDSLHVTSYVQPKQPQFEKFNSKRNWCVGFT